MEEMQLLNQKYTFLCKSRVNWKTSIFLLVWALSEKCLIDLKVTSEPCVACSWWRWDWKCLGVSWVIRVCIPSTHNSCVWLFATPWTVAHQSPPSTGFPRQDYWSGLPFPPPGDLPNPGINPVSLASSALAGRFFATEPLGKPRVKVTLFNLNFEV